MARVVLDASAHRAPCRWGARRQLLMYVGGLLQGTLCQLISEVRIHHRVHTYTVSLLCSMPFHVSLSPGLFGHGRCRPIGGGRWLGGRCSRG